MTFDKTLDAIMQLDFTSREILFELLHKRLIDEKRRQINRNASKSKRDFSKGMLKTKTANEIINELNNE